MLYQLSYSRIHTIPIGMAGIIRREFSRAKHFFN